MKILGAGLSRTGTLSLHSALQILGFKSLHYDTVRLNDIVDGSNPRPDFRRYDDLDAVVDLPAAYFYEELLAAYPECVCILTVRDVDDWWDSVSRHFNDRYRAAPPGSGLKRGVKRAFHRIANRPADHLNRDYNLLRLQLRNMVYGSTTAHEYIYKRKYREHNERVLLKVPAKRLLVMNIRSGDSWDKLCPFLGLAKPEAPFPHEHRTKQSR
jgi:hypothetical protein